MDSECCLFVDHTLWSLRQFPFVWVPVSQRRRQQTNGTRERTPDEVLRSTTAARHDSGGNTRLMTETFLVFIFVFISLQN